MSEVALKRTFERSKECVELFLKKPCRLILDTMQANLRHRFFSQPEPFVPSPHSDTCAAECALEEKTTLYR